MKKIRWNVFLPPWLFMLVIVVLNLTNYNLFIRFIDSCSNWIMEHFTGGFCLLALFSVLLIVITYFSPIGKVRIGGEDCEPMVSYWNYLWIVLCTIMAAGIMLWACAEPMYHIYQPPENITSGSGSTEAIAWAMDTMFLEWSFTPMCIYGLPAILFAFLFSIGNAVISRIIVQMLQNSFLITFKRWCFRVVWNLRII